MDFRMDKSSWALLAFMMATFLFFISKGAIGDLSFGGWMQAVLFGALTTLAFVALASIPVLIYCYFVKMIPDIDYSIRAGAILTVVGILSEIIF